jgi:two-component system, NarL family, nitrate/nitrite response regulator NarL
MEKKWMEPVIAPPLAVLLTGSERIKLKFQHALCGRGDTLVTDSLPSLWVALGCHSPYLVVVDLALAEADLADSLTEIKRLATTAKILLVATSFSAETELSLLGMGVAGCCDEQLQQTAIPRIIDMILDGGVWISHAVMPLLLRTLQARSIAVTAQIPAETAVAPSVPARLHELTPRERQIATLVSSGANNKVIARQLSITDRTVKAHLSAIFQKLGMSDRLQLALFINGAGKEKDRQPQKDAEMQK